MTRRTSIAGSLLAGVLLAGPLLAACSSGTRTPAAGETTPVVSGSPAPGASTASPAPGSSPTTTAQPAPGAPTPVSTPATGSGIAGTTTIAGACPVQRAEGTCPDRAVSAKLSIMDTSTGAVVATAVSGNNGYFTVPLQPGRYTLRAVAYSGAPFRPQLPAMVTVTAGHYATVTLRFDSGIR